MIPVHIIMLVFTIVHCCICFMTRVKKSNITELSTNFSESIFVGVIVYKDTEWIDDIVDIINTARIPSRVFIGVLEYVDELSDSQADKIPNRFRNNIRTITSSARSSQTLSKSRAKLFSDMFRNEKYVLFTKSVRLCNDWDETLCYQLSKVRSKSVLISHLKKFNCFACIEDVKKNEDLKLKLKQFDCLSSSMPIESLVWCSEFSFCLSKYASIICNDETILGVSALLHHNKIDIFYVERTIGIRSDHPYGVKSGKTNGVDSELLDSYLESIGIQNNVISKSALLGLTLDKKKHEYIAKYGSYQEIKFIDNNTFEKYIE